MSTGAVQTLVFVASAYLLGSIPFGLLIGRARGVDVRKAGSGNIGATNVGRLLGKKWGYLCVVLDALKGFVPTLAAALTLVEGGHDAVAFLRWMLVGVAAVLGHVFPIFLRFRGGKGVATTVGVALGVYPYFTVAMLIALACYALVRFTLHVVSLGSLTIAIVFPAALLVYLFSTDVPLGEAWPLIAAAGGLSLLIIVRHIGNIQRLFSGQEFRTR